MIPKNKAKDLVYAYYKLFSIDLENTISINEAAHCSLLAVEEVINSALELNELKYWNEVKKELNEIKKTN
jgi:hypothetical protein